MKGNYIKSKTSSANNDLLTVEKVDQRGPIEIPNPQSSQGIAKAIAYSQKQASKIPLLRTALTSLNR